MKKRLALTSGYFIIMAVTVFFLTKIYLSENLRNSLYLLLSVGAIIFLTSLFKRGIERIMAASIAAYITFIILLIKIFNGSTWFFLGSLLISIAVFIATAAIRTRNDKSDIPSYHRLKIGKGGNKKYVLVN